MKYCLWDNEKRYHHLERYLYLYYKAGAVKTWKVGWVALTLQSGASRWVTVDTPHSSPLALLWPRLFCGRGVACVCRRALLCAARLCVWEKPVTLAAAPRCCWQPRVPGGVLESSLQTMIISSAMVDWKSPSVCTGETCHMASAIGTNIVYMWGKKWKKTLLLILAIEEVHTVLFFTGGQATRECGRVNFSLLSTHLHWYGHKKCISLWVYKTKW